MNGTWTEMVKFTGAIRINASIRETQDSIVLLTMVRELAAEMEADNVNPAASAIRVTAQELIDREEEKQG